MLTLGYIILKILSEIASMVISEARNCSLSLSRNTLPKHRITAASGCRVAAECLTELQPVISPSSLSQTWDCQHVAGVIKKVMVLGTFVQFINFYGGDKNLDILECVVRRRLHAFVVQF